ncbi:MAG TPA: site-specific DNA-methyltransferase, partial [Candidatus Saccharimonadia bacterium]
MNNDANLNEISEVQGATPDFKAELASQLQELVPEAITDGKVDVTKLNELLSDDTADESERFGLFWPGKKRAMRAAQESTPATLKPAMNESKDWETTENVFIEGDNLEVLKVMQKHYHNSVKMIYIDPPYNTGKDFVYPDNYIEGLQSYLEYTKQLDEEGHKVSTNSETDGRYHSNWLNMMYPRLKLGRNLLTGDGVMYISIDDHEAENLKKMCHEIFGENNFLAQIVWANKEGGGGSDSTTFKVKHEYILAYAKNKDKVRIYGEEVEDDSSYPHSDEFVAERGKYKLIKLNSFSIQYSASLDYPIAAPDGAEVVPEEDGRRAIWRWSRKKYDWGVENGFIVHKQKDDGRWIIYTKQYYRVDNDNQPIVRTLPPFALIEKYSSTGATKGITELFGKTKLFDYPKPFELIVKLAEWVTKDNDLVLDFFSGSGTTAHAIMKLNANDGGTRRNIQVQLPEPSKPDSEAYKAGYKNIADLAKERVRLAGEKVKADVTKPLDVGFRAYKLADTNFTKWSTSSSVDVDALQQHLLTIRESSNDDATQEDLLAELLLKLGVSLTARAEKKEVGGLPVWS